jgi:hypothetical protein
VPERRNLLKNNCSPQAFRFNRELVRRHHRGMKQQRVSDLVKLALCLGALGASACDDGDSWPAGQMQELAPVCVAQGSVVPAGSWLCPAPLTLQCGAPIPPVYVTDALNPSCGGVVLAADPIATAVGTQPVRVRRADGALACETTLTIVSAPPVLTPKTIELWPPNHKLHAISVEDCVGVVASCDPNVRAEFIWASSDEPIDDLGDGHHAPDIWFDDCQTVHVRAERQGPKDGRVYKLGVRVIDSAGLASESQCSIVVDHDKRGVPGAHSGDKYRVTFDGQNGAPRCGIATPPAPPVLPPDAGPVVPVPVDAGTPPIVMTI